MATLIKTYYTHREPKFSVGFPVLGLVEEDEDGLYIHPLITLEHYELLGELHTRPKCIRNKKLDRERARIREACYKAGASNRIS